MKEERVITRADLGIVSMADVKAVPISWIWRPYIPRGAVTLLAGDGGYGKSWMTASIAADLSQGRPLPGQEAQPAQRILMFSAEDGLGQVMRPKLELLGADVGRIGASDKGFVVSEGHRDQIIGMVRDYDIAIVFVDPLVVYFGGKRDMFRANETREAMGLLTDVAKETSAAVVAVHHVRKSSSGSLQQKVMGSGDFVNSVRSVLLVDISKGGQRYMTHVKSNWAATGPSLAYQFGPKGFQWQGLYDEESAGPKINRNKRGEVAKWLRVRLAGGPVPSSVILKEAEALGYCGSLQRARKEVGVKSETRDRVAVMMLE